MFIWSRTIATDLETVLEDLRWDARDKTGVDYFSRTQKSGNDLFVTCVNHEAHQGEERTPSCSIDRDTGIFNCFGCSFSGSLPVLISRVLGLKGPLEGYRWLLRKYSTPIRAERELVPLDLSQRGPKESFLDESVLAPYSYYHPYMFKRGLDEATIELFDIGYCRKTKSITIPMRDSKGRLLFIKKRPINKTFFAKYKIEEGANKRGILFGLNIVKQNLQRVKTIYLCEGEFDALSYYVLQEYGLGIQGSELFRDQVKELIRVAKGIPICLSFDNDPAGIQAKRRAVELLQPYFPLSELVYPVELLVKDPNDLLLRNLLKSAKTRPIGIK